ncbi:hypothetical protein SPPR111872_12170 [Sphingobacterium prati]
MQVAHSLNFLVFNMAHRPNTFIAIISADEKGKHNNLVFKLAYLQRYQLCPTMNLWSFIKG